MNVIENIIYPEWKRIASKLLIEHINYYKINFHICNTNKIYQPIETFLSERYKDCINRQISGMLQSKISNFKTKFNKIVLNCDSFDDETKMKLCFINKYNLYYYKTDYKSKNIEVSKDLINVAKSIFKRFIGKFPDCGGINMVMQDKIAKLELPKKVDLKRYSYVIRLSTNEKGKLIDLPLLRNKYEDDIKGILNSSTEFVFKKNKLIFVKISKDLKNEINKKTLSDNIISLDIGLNNLISTNKGELFGIRFLRNLKRMDKNLIKIMNSLKIKHGKNVKLSQFDEYNNLVKRIRDYTKNEVNRIINKIYLRYNPKTINVENLDFKNSNLSKKLNRLLNNFGLGSITNKLKSLEDLGVKINYIDPAYSSQTCSNCGYVHKDNRKKQEQFNCKCCGLKQHADINPTRVIEKFSERFGTKIFYGKSGRENKLKLLIEDFKKTYFGRQFWMNNESVIQAFN